MEEEILDEAYKLYTKGNRLKAIEMIEETDFTKISNLAEAKKTLGLSYYFEAIKGPKEKKKENLKKAKSALSECIRIAKKEETIISAYNILPLVLWILGEKDEAWNISDIAVKMFPKVPSVWNTRSILCRWANKIKESINVCQEVYKTAIEIEDYRTAGHGKNNMAVALMMSGRIAEARKNFYKAIELYKKFEEDTGQSATSHIDGVEEKLSNLLA